MERIRIQFKDLFVGMVVEDLDPDYGIGIIKKCDDIHNVEVYLDSTDDTEHFSFYCLDENCMSGDYNPLYYTIKDNTILSRKLK